MKNYDAKEIEKKWQEYWKEQNTYRTPDKVEGKENFYALSEFAYPSGNLHVGHWYAFAVPDIYARYKRMKGYNVLYPIGFDAFGLPAENAAIKRNLDPKEWTYANMDYMRKQLASMGASFDWERSFATTDPEYYQWTQWMFTQFYKHGLVEQMSTKANWCDSCKTVLANEQVVGGKCERCDSDVVQKDMKQWAFKITDFADELIDDLEELPWDESIKQAQREWIGRKEGSEISFEIQMKSPQKNADGTRNNAEVPFRKVLLLHGYGGTGSQGWFDQLKNFFGEKDIPVLAPDFPNTEKPNYQEWLEYFEEKILPHLSEDTLVIGHSLGPSFFMRVASEKNISLENVLLVAPVLHNKIDDLDTFFEKEFDFEKLKKIWKQVYIIGSNNDPYIEEKDFIELSQKLNADFIRFENEGHFSQNNEESPKIIEFIQKIFFDNKDKKQINVFTTRADTLFGATYVVLAPEHPLVQELKDSIENWDEVEAYLETTAKKSELERQQSKTKTGVRLQGIQAINPATKEAIPVFIADYVLAHFGTGAVMAVPTHDERDAEFALKFDLPFTFVVLPSAGEPGKEQPLVTFGENEFIKKAGEGKKGQEKIQAEWNAMYDALNEAHEQGGILPKGKRFGCAFEGKLINSDRFSRMTSEEARPAITEAVGGTLKKTYRLRDWGISRQRYWGTPIPMVYDPEGNPHPVPDEHLPWLLPEDVDHTPDGTAPLARSQELKERTEKIFGEGWTPEVDTMDTFVDSSWYFYRYLDNKNNEEFASAEKRKLWMPVDMYFGGAEHTTMHLLYSRFWTKALHRIGLVEKKEPYYARLNRGLILGPDGAKMSKSKGNVIDPDEVVAHVGADAVRMYLAFIGPFNEPGNYPWDPNGVVGVRRFIERMYGLTEKVGEASSDALVKLTHKTIQKVSEDVERLKLNTAISSMMVWVNAAEKEAQVGKREYEQLLKMFASFAPHIAEEIWQENLGHDTSIHLESWPEHDPALAKDDKITLALQVNGKVRAQLTIPADAEEEEVRAQALALPEIQKWIDGKEVKKFIYVKGRIINIVV